VISTTLTVDISNLRDLVISLIRFIDINNSN